MVGDEKYEGITLTCKLRLDGTVDIEAPGGVRIDPGMSNPMDKQEISRFLRKSRLVLFRHHTYRYVESIASPEPSDGTSKEIVGYVLS